MKNENENEKVQKNINLNKSKSPFKEANKRRESNFLFPKIYSDIQELFSRKKIKDISLKDISDKKIKELFFLLNKKHKERKGKDNIEIFLYLLKTKLKDNLKSDLLYTGYNLDTLFNFINPYITGEIYNSGEIIYSNGEHAENLYVILRGNIGKYKLVVTDETLSCEDYYLYLYEQYYHYKTILIDSFKENDIYIKEKEYTDLDLLLKVVQKNKDIFPLNSFDDIEDLKTIMMDVNLYIIYVENKPGDITDVFQKFKFPNTYLDYDKLLTNEITPPIFISNLSKRIKKREQFYIKYLASNSKKNVKIMKYVKTKDLKANDCFGNFEIINTNPIRINTTRCESDSTLLITINKNSYSRVINTIQKEKRDKEINFLFSCFYFKIISREYFELKMLSKYKLQSFFKGNILINQGEKLNNFIFIRDGTVQASINNISLVELSNKIKMLYLFILKNAKKYNVNIKDIIDFDTSLNYKTNLKSELLKEKTLQKQNFILTITEKGNLGDYEYSFNTPSFITATIISQESKIYFYDYNDFTKINDEMHSLKENLRDISFNKLAHLLKRMINVYNTHFNFYVKEVEEKEKEKEKENDNKKEVFLQKSNSKGNIKDETNGDLTIEKPKIFTSPIIHFKKNKLSLFNLVNHSNTNILNTDKENSNTSTDKKRRRKVFSFSNNFEKIDRENNRTQIRRKMQIKKKYDLLIKKVFHTKHNKGNSKNKKINLNNFSSDKNRTNINKNLVIYSFKGKKLSCLSNTKSTNISKKKLDNKSNIEVLKTENSSQVKLFDLLLPSILSQKKVKKLNESKEDKECNKYVKCRIFKHSLSDVSYINDISLEKEKKNSKNKKYSLLFSNYTNKKINDISNKLNSIRLVQLDIIKNRNQKKNLLTKSNEEET